MLHLLHQSTLPHSFNSACYHSDHSDFKPIDRRSPSNATWIGNIQHELCRLLWLRVCGILRFIRGWEVNCWLRHPSERKMDDLTTCFPHCLQHHLCHHSCESSRYIEKNWWPGRSTGWRQRWRERRKQTPTWDRHHRMGQGIEVRTFERKKQRCY